MSTDAILEWMTSDATLIMVVFIGASAYIGTVMAQAIVAIIDWLRDRRRSSAEDLEGSINEGTVPRDYSRKMKAAMEEVNSIQQFATDFRDSERAIGRLEALKALRTTVAHIRQDGYVRGEAHRHKGIFNPGSCPHRKGSGTAQQWVRGYCQGANVLDPKPYIDEA